MDHLAALTLLLAVLPLSHAGCKEDLAQSQGFQDCFMGFMTFFQNMGSGMDISSPDSMFQLICSDEGKAAFGCVIKYMKQCPQVMEQPDGSNPMSSLSEIPGFDMETFFSEGGMDAVCAMMVGPCSAVRNCFVMPTTEPGVMKRQTPTVNYYQFFQTQASELCGEEKTQVSCVLDALKNCPPSVINLVELQFENAIKGSMPDALGIVSFKDTRKFVEEECPKMPSGFLGNACMQEVLSFQNFTKCDENATMKYRAARTCMVYQLSKSCIANYMEPQCDENTVQFLERNIHVVYPGIPSNCEKLTSGGDVGTTPFQLLLIAPLLLLSLI